MPRSLAELTDGVWARILDTWVDLLLFIYVSQARLVLDIWTWRNNSACTISVFFHLSPLNTVELLGAEFQLSINLTNLFFPSPRSQHMSTCRNMSFILAIHRPKCQGETSSCILRLFYTDAEQTKNTTSRKT
ncbi:hypothetical protein OCU04_007618 [Sclerotinia nivalis]|uniref:Uncharacterized protein n=1 Tax=Sclerotinia nivalis TaxID=352851 RepID=A0A9X0AJ55_9HELO|nr:hypothetical protein OCU04_007618 [Sclerotinia nivalis]